MTCRSHTHEEVFPVPAQRLFKTLITPSSIQQWWGAASVIIIPEPDGIWAMTWGSDDDDSDFITVATIAEFEPNRRIALNKYIYRSKDGPLPFDADFVVEFRVESRGDEAMLRVTQQGFPSSPDADEYFRGCQDGWKRTFDGIRQFLAATAVESDGNQRS